MGEVIGYEIPKLHCRHHRTLEIAASILPRWQSRRSFHICCADLIQPSAVDNARVAGMLICWLWRRRAGKQESPGVSIPPTCDNGRASPAVRSGIAMYLCSGLSVLAARVHTTAALKQESWRSSPSDCGSWSVAAWAGLFAEEPWRGSLHSSALPQRYPAE